ncbi:MAG: tRNA (adenosine(37)-N6)-dimethylallyltransferase MiaA [Parcubacteria group bacterium CG_4_9_14_0_2_um_filter_41_8]|nr:MAG: tRNA (adenosine(37)-N6)-dimethylallyltransferase MiaA [Parcubacteria group bacterium CG11_big_fil_rev_8_21_14_0_20_41_14]PJC40547.1 MAG: tRNA (adenosine(37)-N6)-dimethylallyltransferase MiaA [Parcubacteria group bacterium CG_4_9_14_0_2_um_filter_41_8]
MNQLITILGPTASGKSTLGIELAQDLNGEIVSADSRQVFRGLDIGSGKVTNEEQAQVPHYLLDVVDPMDDFSVSHFQKLAFTAIDDIIGRNKLPFLVGGTALYIYSVIDNYKLQDIAPDPKLRKQFEKKSLSELQAMVPDGALNKDDYNNPRRLIRAIEKLEAGVPIEPQKGPQKYENIIFGIDFPREELYQRIDQRVDERLKDGMIEEVENLRANGVSDEWLVSLGLEYKWITEFLQGKWQRDEMIKRLKGAIHAFARRQMTWFKKDKQIIWVKDAKEAEKILEKKMGFVKSQIP